MIYIKPDTSLNGNNLVIINYINYIMRGWSDS